MNPSGATATTPPFPRRSRLLYAFLIMLAIAAGLASRSSLAAHLSDFLATYAGDTLWALTLFLVLAFIRPTAWPGMIAVSTLALAFVVEASQLYQAGWINAVRDTRIGALILGHGFLWSDLLCYTVGVGAGWLAELVVAASRSRGLGAWWSSWCLSARPSESVAEASEGPADCGPGAVPSSACGGR